jgi:hypothetical protein
MHFSVPERRANLVRQQLVSLYELSKGQQQYLRRRNPGSATIARFCCWQTLDQTL